MKNIKSEELDTSTFFLLKKYLCLKMIDGGITVSEQGDQMSRSLKEGVE